MVHKILSRGKCYIRIKSFRRTWYRKTSAGREIKDRKSQTFKKEVVRALSHEQWLVSKH